jgi:hypothetical protein
VSYANETAISVEKSRAELESILNRYGATRFGYMTEPNRAVICFVAKNKGVKFVLPLPDRSEKRFRVTGHNPPRLRNDSDAYLAWEQACRSRWRALCLCVKAKLEAVASGITTFEAEFLAHFVLPNGETFGEYSIPQLDQMQNGRIPLLQLTNGLQPQPKADK